jgi:prepilin-type processing-associated H-X9-DG protein
LVPPSGHPDPRDVLIYEPQGCHRGLSGGNVAYADGHVAWRTPQQLEADLTATHHRQGVIAEPSHR